MHGIQEVLQVASTLSKEFINKETRDDYRNDIKSTQRDRKFYKIVLRLGGA